MKSNKTVKTCVTGEGLRLLPRRCRHEENNTSRFSFNTSFLLSIVPFTSYCRKFRLGRKKAKV